MSRHVIKASATQNLETEPVGLINRFYGTVYHPIASRLNQAGRRLKQTNRRLYYVVKYGAVLLLSWAIFW